MTMFGDYRHNNSPSAILRHLGHVIGIKIARRLCLWLGVTVATTEKQWYFRIFALVSVTVCCVYVLLIFIWYCRLVTNGNDKFVRNFNWVTLYMLLSGFSRVFFIFVYILVCRFMFHALTFYFAFQFLLMRQLLFISGNFFFNLKAL